jgi:hypothetical protein
MSFHSGNSSTTSLPVSMPDTLLPMLLTTRNSLAQHHVALSLVYRFFLYYPGLYFTTSKFRSATNNPRYQRSLGNPFVSHAIASMIEMPRLYYFLFRDGYPPVPTQFDLIVCIIQAFTGLVVSTYVATGNIPVVKSTYHASAVIRVVYGAVAYANSDPELHQKVVYMLDGFAWVRVGFASMPMLAGLQTWTANYTASAVLAVLVTSWDVPYGVPLALVLMGLSLRVSRWAGLKLEKK